MDDGCEAALVGFLFSIAFEYVHRFVMLGHAAVVKAPQIGRVGLKTYRVPRLC